MVFIMVIYVRGGGEERRRRIGGLEKRYFLTPKPSIFFGDWCKLAGGFYSIKSGDIYDEWTCILPVNRDVKLKVEDMGIRMVSKRWRPRETVLNLKFDEYEPKITVDEINVESDVKTSFIGCDIVKPNRTCEVKFTPSRDERILISVVHEKPTSKITMYVGEKRE
ncbi:MAG: hypothetical protein OH337_03860 [Candidatus Parvarchaeota archaeon]|nr:hypothetical protein [Candidatus Haiyanarchaeum thermophilum]